MTKPQLAKETLPRALAAGVPVGWGSGNDPPCIIQRNPVLASFRIKLRYVTSTSPWVV